MAAVFSTGMQHAIVVATRFGMLKGLSDPRVIVTHHLVVIGMGQFVQDRLRTIDAPC